MKILCSLAFLAASLNTSLALGQSAPSKDSARAHFSDGLAHVAHGEVAVALQEFEAAYALAPHYSVLYNIGQAHAALGHASEAVGAFERHLLEGGNRINQARREQVRALIAANRAKLGELRLSGVGTSTRVWLDGVELERPALAEPLRLNAGKHAILSSHRGEAPASQTVLVVAAAPTHLKLPEEPAIDVAPAAPPAALRIVCDLPGVTVEVNGARRGITPVADPLVVDVGPLDVRFSRAGYREVTRHVLAQAGAPAVVHCDQVVEPVLAPAEGGKLIVLTTPSDANLFVDGQRFLGEALPYGPHELRIEREGFASQTRTIAIRSRDVATYQVTLAATPARQTAEKHAKSRRRLLGYATGGGGFAFAIAGAALLGWNGTRYDAWHRDRESSASNQFQTVASIQRVDDIAFGSVALGAGLLVTSVWLLFTEPSELP